MKLSVKEGLAQNGYPNVEQALEECTQFGAPPAGAVRRGFPGRVGPGYRPKWRGVAAIGGRGNLR